MTKKVGKLIAEGLELVASVMMLIEDILWEVVVVIKMVVVVEAHNMHMIYKIPTSILFG